MGTNKPHMPATPPGGSPARQPASAAVSYFNAKGILREELVDAEAEEQAKELARARMAATQLRRYYADVLSIRRRLEHDCANREETSREEIFAQLRPEFKMLRAKAYYAHGRDRGTFPVEMKEFIEKHVTSVKTVLDFDAFCKHFEAVVAFHRFHGKK